MPTERVAGQPVTSTTSPMKCSPQGAELNFAADPLSVAYRRYLRDRAPSWVSSFAPCVNAMTNHAGDTCAFCGVIFEPDNPTAFSEAEETLVGDAYLCPGD